MCDQPDTTGGRRGKVDGWREARGRRLRRGYNNDTLEHERGVRSARVTPPIREGRPLAFGKRLLTLVVARAVADIDRLDFGGRSNRSTSCCASTSTAIGCWMNK